MGTLRIVVLDSLLSMKVHVAYQLMADSFVHEYCISYHSYTAGTWIIGIQKLNHEEENNI